MLGKTSKTVKVQFLNNFIQKILISRTSTKVGEMVFGIRLVFHSQEKIA